MFARWCIGPIPVPFLRMNIRSLAPPLAMFRITRRALFPRIYGGSVDMNRSKSSLLIVSYPPFFCVARVDIAVRDSLVCRNARV
jgi:hypothetical protein